MRIILLYIIKVGIKILDMHTNYSNTKIYKQTLKLLVITRLK